MAKSNATRIAVDASVEFLTIFALWVLFVSKIDAAEFYLGIGVALVGSVADQVVKNQDVIEFRPRLKHVMLIWTEPYYAITGTASIFKALARHFLGKKSEAQFRFVAYAAGGDDAESQARRALMAAYMSIPPNFIVVGIDCEHDGILVHQVSPTPTPLIAKQLGALE